MINEPILVLHGTNLPQMHHVVLQSLGNAGVCKPELSPNKFVLIPYYRLDL